MVVNEIVLIQIVLMKTAVLMVSSWTVLRFDVIYGNS